MARIYVCCIYIHTYDQFVVGVGVEVEVGVEVGAGGRDGRGRGGS